MFSVNDRQDTPQIISFVYGNSHYYFGPGFESSGEYSWWKCRIGGPFSTLPPPAEELPCATGATRDSASTTLPPLAIRDLAALHRGGMITIFGLSDQCVALRSVVEGTGELLSISIQRLQLIDGRVRRVEFSLGPDVPSIVFDKLDGSEPAIRIRNAHGYGIGRGT
jgi:hypothetical protein